MENWRIMEFVINFQGQEKSWNCVKGHGILNLKEKAVQKVLIWKREKSWNL